MTKIKHRFRLAGKTLNRLITLSVWMLQTFSDLRKMCPQELQYKIYSFASESVPDPWYTGDFEETYARITSGCQSWLDRLENESDNGKA